MERLVAVLGALLAIGCAAPPRCAYPSAPRAPAGEAYRYRVSASPRGEELCVEVDLPEGSGGTRPWAPEGPLSAFVVDAALEGEVGSTPIRRVDRVFPVPACTARGGCRLRYRVMLGEAARALDDFDLAEDHRGALLAPPSSWLMRPLATRGPFALAVSTPPGTGFLTGLASREGAYRGDVGALDDTPYAVFGPLVRRDLALGGELVQIAIAPGNPAPEARAAIEAWVLRAASAVRAYHGRFPMERAAVIVTLTEGRGPGSGHTMGNGGGAILISAGESSRAGDFDDDWILVHEMVHLSFPDVRTPWAEEGLSTYLEPIIRARAGMIDADEVWRGLVEGLPRGQPEAGDRGLDHTDTWGRRYWGGAGFWLLADLRIREQTSGQRSLDDGLRALNRAGGAVSARWDLDRALRAIDDAVGVRVLGPLRAELGNAPVSIDLAGLWQRLGVSVEGSRVRYDDAAPLASVRRAIVAIPRGGEVR